MEPRADHTTSYPSYPNETFRQLKNVIVGEQFAVMLVAKGIDTDTDYPRDSYLCVLYVEDDGQWSPTNGSGFSGFWLFDIIHLLEKARDQIDCREMMDE